MARDVSVRELRNHTADVLRPRWCRLTAELRDALGEALPGTVDEL